MDEQPAHVLHPDVPNFLKPRDKHWPPAGASMVGTLARGWSSGDPKGFNSLLENGAEVGELLEQYAALPIADRNVWTNPDEWHGELANRIEITDDFREFTIYLRKGVKWHQPPNVDLDDPKYKWLAGDHEFTAHDLVFTLAMITNPQVEDGATKNYYSEPSRKASKPSTTTRSSFAGRSQGVPERRAQTIVRLARDARVPLRHTTRTVISRSRRSRSASASISTGTTTRASSARARIGWRPTNRASRIRASLKAKLSRTS